MGAGTAIATAFAAGGGGDPIPLAGTVPAVAAGAPVVVLDAAALQHLEGFRPSSSGKNVHMPHTHRWQVLHKICMLPQLSARTSNSQLIVHRANAAA